MPRPAEIGMDIRIDSLESADRALHELGWLQHEDARLSAIAKQEIEALKLRHASRRMLLIEGVEVAIADRIEALLKPLLEWTAANIDRHLAGKKTKVLAHGELGLRQQPRVVEFDVDQESQKPYTAEEVLNWIRESEDLKTSQKKALTETKTTLHLKGAKDAFEAGKITADELAGVGLVVREACDAPFVKPAKIAVTAE